MKTFALMAVTAMYAAAEADNLVDSIANDIQVPQMDDSVTADDSIMMTDAQPLEVMDDSAMLTAAAEPVAMEMNLDVDTSGPTNEAIAASIDETMANAGQVEEDNPMNDPIPDNYRPPPVQDIRRRERRERPDIHAHALLKSMDLGFVNNGFGGNQRPKEDGPIGFLGTPVSEAQQRRGMMGNFAGLGAGVGGYGGYGQQP